MKFFHPINVNALDRTVYLNPAVFEHTAENLERIKKGKAPLGIDNKPINLHHVGREHNGSLATLTDSFHHKHTSKIHNLEPADPVDRKAFKKEKPKIWKAIGEWLDDA